MERNVWNDVQSSLMRTGAGTFCAQSILWKETRFRRTNPSLLCLFGRGRVNGYQEQLKLDITISFALLRLRASRRLRIVYSS